MNARTRIAITLAVGVAVALGGPSAAGPQDQAAAPPLEKAIAVAADAGWVDAGIDVAPGDQIQFAASGQVDLQRGNPEAQCGPAGLDLITVDQPIPNENIGELIGKIAQLVATRLDPKSGLEIRDEVFVLFPVGPERTVTAPLKGRLYLGINENVLKDNGGNFAVTVTRRPL
jgi:hypothetical protein